MDYAQVINNFALLARRYCKWCEEHQLTDPKSLHYEAIGHLAQLYAAGLTLPDVDVTDHSELSEPPKEAIQAIYRSFGALPFNYYRDFFSPHIIDQSNEPGMGDLADDLTDIYLDLHRGLALLDSGIEAAAAWEWRFSFGIHWGRHAVSALRALHCYDFPDEYSK
jgi:hypothetical protein